MPSRSLQDVRPRLDADGDEDVYDDVETQIRSEGDRDADEDVDMDEEEDSDTQSEQDAESFELKIRNVSFGALKEAQDSISRKRKRVSEETSHDQEEKLAALRQRLQQLREQEGPPKLKTKPDKKPQHISGSSSLPAEEPDESMDDSDSAPSEEDAPKSRTSKHAPAAQSSKRQVSRRRTVVDIPKRVVRDPRFDALHQSSAHPGNSDKAYSFLREYQKSEIEELKGAIKKAKTEEDKELLKRKVGSMENRLKAKEAKEREQEIIRKHRKEERDAIRQGKTPYYLKKKDIKEKALVEKYKGMKSKDREKLIEKRRKKEGQKEKKRMPQARRMVG